MATSTLTLLSVSPKAGYKSLMCAPTVPKKAYCLEGKRDAIALTVINIWMGSREIHARSS